MKGLEIATYHSRSLYIMVKKTCKNRLTALINTANKNSHPSPDMIVMCFLVDQVKMWFWGAL